MKDLQLNVWYTTCNYEEKHLKNNVFYSIRRKNWQN